MNRYLAIIAVLILGVVLLGAVYFINESVKKDKEEFKSSNSNESDVSSRDPHKFQFAELDESCDSLFDRNGYVSVQEFMDGKRYKCY